MYLDDENVPIIICQFVKLERCHYCT